MGVSIICQPMGVFAILNQHHWGTTSPRFPRPSTVPSPPAAAPGAAPRPRPPCGAWTSTAATARTAATRPAPCGARATAAPQRCWGAATDPATWHLVTLPVFRKKKALKSLAESCQVLFLCGRKWVTNPCFCPSFVQNHLGEELLHQLQGFRGGFAAHALHWATLLDR